MIVKPEKLIKQFRLNNISKLKRKDSASMRGRPRLALRGSDFFGELVRPKLVRE